jgi:hypothetical protein
VKTRYDEVAELCQRQEDLLALLLAAYTALRVAGWADSITGRKVRAELEKYKLLSPEPTV